MSMVLTDRKQIEDIYGVENVKIWADLDNTGKEKDIELRVNTAIKHAGMYINGRMVEGPYPPPYEDPIPEAIAYMASLKAGINLFNGRKIVDAEDENSVSKQEQELEDLLRQIDARIFKIYGYKAASTDYPKVLGADNGTNYG